MSLCRWSSNDYQCDVYVYGSDVGWMTHVAGRRYVFTQPLPPVVELPRGFTDDQFEAWWERQQTVQAMLNPDTMVGIGLPHDGESFTDPTADGCADRLEALQCAGYRVPQRAIDALRGDRTGGAVWSTLVEQQ